jgi:hypothetical protein
MRIAQHLGLTNIRTPRDTLRFFGVLAGTTVIVFLLFKEFLSVAFSIFNLVGALPATFLAELTVTNFVGILFWVGFAEVKKEKPFRIPKASMLFMWAETKNLVKHQWNVVKGTANPRNLKMVGGRFLDWINGNLILRQVKVSEKAFVAASMATLISGNASAFEGPVGKLFLESVRSSHPELQDADLVEMSQYFEKYDDDQMRGVLSDLKGDLHERMVAAAENTDGDQFIARLHDDPYHRSTDLVFENTETGESFAVSLKATDSDSYIEHALSRYPGDPIMATDEVAKRFGDDDRVVSSGILNEELESVTAENFDKLLQEVNPSSLDTAGGVLIGSSLAAAVAIWPFFVALQRERISKEKFEMACAKILGKSGLRLVPRLMGSIALGPIYMWYALAKGVMSLNDLVDPVEETKATA